MTAHTATKTREAADVLDMAASHIERVGHHKGYLYDERQAKGTAMESCRVCAIGAILAAAYGKPRYPGTEPVNNVTDLAIHALTEQVGDAIPSWNDSPERTVDDVLTALRDTASSLRTAA